MQATGHKMMYLLLLLLCFFATIGCDQIPSTKDLDKDIDILRKQVEQINQDAAQYGGLVHTLMLIRTNVVKNTLAALEQKATGYKRFIPITYTINLKEFDIRNKDDQLKGLDASILEIKTQIKSAEEENNRYSGGLLKALILTRKAIAENTLAFLEQKRMLLKHDIPIVTVMPDPKQLNEDKSKNSFQKSPGSDQDNL